MKRTNYTSRLLSGLFLLFCSSAFTQTSFSTTLYFTDAVGHSDSLVVGYDPLGTDTIDTVLGEENIISIPLDSNFDVRFTDVWANHYQNLPGSYHTKKQWVKATCSTYLFNIQTIEIFTNNWPVTMTWDNQAFATDGCAQESVMTGTSPGGWWDVGSPSWLHRQEMDEAGSVTFFSNESSDEFQGSYINDNGNMVSIYWFVLSTWPQVSTYEQQQDNGLVKVSPNPTTGELFVMADELFGMPEQIDLFDTFGRIVATYTSNPIHLAKLPTGTYTLRATNSKGKMAFKRVVKSTTE